MKAEFISGLRWVASARLVGQILSWISTIWVMRLLAPQDYGVVAIVSLVMGLAIMATEMGFGAALVQTPSYDEVQLRSIASLALALASAMALVVFLAAPWAAEFFRSPQSADLIRVAALQLLISSLGTVPDALLRRTLAFKPLSILELVSGLAATLTTLTLARLGFGAASLVYGPLVGAGLRLLQLAWYSPRWVWPSMTWRPAIPLVRFGSTVTVSRFAGYVSGQSDVAIGGRLLSTTQLGEYSIAMQLAMLPLSKLLGVLNSVTFPIIARLSAQREALAKALMQGLKSVAYIVLPLLWGLAALAPWLLPKLLGPTWGGAVIPLQIVCGVIPLRMINVLLSTALHGVGAAKQELKNTVTGVVIMPLAFAIGAQWGVVGLAVGWAVGLPLVVALNLMRSRTHLHIAARDVLIAVLRPALLSAIMAALMVVVGATTGAWAHTWLGLASLMALGALTYLTSFWLLDRKAFLELVNLVRPVQSLAKTPELPE